MPRTKAEVDVTPGSKTKESEISSLKGSELAKPIKFSFSWEVPSVDEIVTALSSDETKNSILEEIATARMNAAQTEARSKAISENEPPELKIARFVKFAMKMQPGVTEEAATAQAKVLLGLS